MSCRFASVSCLLVLGLFSSVSFGQAPSSPLAEEQKLEDIALKRFVEKLDVALEDHWKKNKVTPAPVSSDAEFHRRAYLHLTGRIPTINETRTFLDNKNTNKREELIDSLLDKATTTNHLTLTLMKEWLPQIDDNFQFSFFAQNFEPWLKERIRTNVRMDKIVRELLTATNNQNVNANPQIAFFLMNESKPENVASSVGRLFLGVKIDCAQCHAHPFAPIKREQFWETAAFFKDVAPNASRFAKVNPPEIKIPETDKTVKAKFFDGKEHMWEASDSPRRVFADWLLDPKNPYFAKNIANRYWSYFMGRGIQHPVDEPSDDNPPTIPKLLEELTKGYIAEKFNTKLLMRVIMRSKAYQLSSQQTDESQADLRHFARMPLQGLTGEQLFDSISTATGIKDLTPVDQRRFGAGPRTEFVRKFRSSEGVTEKQTSILQALSLMNGKLVTEATTPDVGRFLTGILEAPFLNNDEKIEALFLATLSRKPTAEELRKYRSYFDRGGAVNSQRKALGDIFWALLNSTEFVSNH